MLFETLPSHEANSRTVLFTTHDNIKIHLQQPEQLKAKHSFILQPFMAVLN